jgi:hypothetical protein
LAQRGDKPKALVALEGAMELHDPGLVRTKVDNLLDPLRAEPRYRAVLARLKFPD